MIISFFVVAKVFSKFPTRASAIFAKQKEKKKAKH